MWRALECVPGTLAWLAIILPFIFSAFAPVLSASFIIIYTVIWFFRSTKLSFNLYRSTFKIKKALSTDWNALINLIDHPEKIDDNLRKLSRQEKKEHFLLKQEIAHLKTINQYKKSSQILHAILYVTYKESLELIRESIKSYATSQYNPARIIMVFAGEESDKENFLAIAKAMETEFGSKFKHWITTVHPKNIPGEIKGKSANSTYAAKELKKYLDAQKIKYDDVMVSGFDADTVVHPSYFTELTYHYLITDHRTEKGYQPTHMFHNNIWDVPVMIRMVALACTFWRMAESMEKEKYKSFSSRSISFETIVEVNYWDPSIIPEDSRQYWTAYTLYNGRHELIPIYCPIYMDAVLSDTYVKTFKSQYSQLRRWAWGVCDFPFMFLNLWYHQHIQWSKKVLLIGEFLKNSIFWSTGPILLTFMGFLPGLLNQGFRDTVLAYNLPTMMSNILTLASIGIVVCTLVSLVLIPKNPKRDSLARLSLCFQWILIPFVSIFLSAIPALDAQTRLLFGKYLEYRVTEKARK